MALAVQRRGMTRSGRSRGTWRAFFSVEEAVEAGGAPGVILGDGEGSGHGIDEGHGDGGVGHVQNGTRKRLGFAGGRRRPNRRWGVADGYRVEDPTMDARATATEPWVNRD